MKFEVEGKNNQKLKILEIIGRNRLFTSKFQLEKEQPENIAV